MLSNYYSLKLAFRLTSTLDHYLLLLITTSTQIAKKESPFANLSYF